MSPRPGVAYKILTGAQWAEWQARGTFAGAPVDLADGFVHLSDAGQVAGTLDKHFAGQDGLVLAAVDLAALGDLVKWEVSRGGALFPHVYGALPLAVVIAHGPVARGADGAVVLPG
ncbi:MAG: DUF952 domain-containing protein [Sphingomonadales bacterium]|nr:DUF952 domain-containing protein [Sphingomonadales bacterium]